MADTREAPALMLVDVGAEGVALLTEPEWTAGDRNSRTLVKADRLRIVLTALRENARLGNEDPDEAVAIQPLQGELAVTVQGQEIVLRAGQLVCVFEGNPWDVRATADSLFLLSVGRPHNPASVGGEGD
jgi:quercetin dioxygenase-like cupin family protein